MLTSCDAPFRAGASDSCQVDVVLLGQVLGGWAGKDLVAGRGLLPHTGHRGFINLGWRGRHGLQTCKMLFATCHTASMVQSRLRLSML